MPSTAGSTALMNLPLFLSYQGVIVGKGFIASIDACLKLVAKKREGGTDLFGVMPASVVSIGVDLDEAHAKMRDALRERLVEIAKSVETFDQFKTDAEKFLYSVDEVEEAAWLEAVARVRSEQNLDRHGLKTVKAETTAYARVTPRKAEDLTPDLNEPTPQPLSGARHVGLAA